MSWNVNLPAPRTRTCARQPEYSLLPLPAGLGLSRQLISCSQGTTQSFSCYWSVASLLPNVAGGSGGGVTVLSLFATCCLRRSSKPWLFSWAVDRIASAAPAVKQDDDGWLSSDVHGSHAFTCLVTRWGRDIGFLSLLVEG